MLLGKNPLSHRVEFKYSERQNVVWAIHDVNDNVHISFYPHGPGAEEYNGKILSTISNWAQEYGETSARNLEWFKLWMLNSLPFDMFHVTVGEKHFYFNEEGGVLGESTPRGVITEEDRVAAWKASGYALNGAERPWPPVYNFSTDPSSYWNRTSSFPQSGAVHEGTYAMNPYESSWPRMEWSAKTQSFSFK
jgi:hypothetical protein